MPKSAVRKPGRTRKLAASPSNVWKLQDAKAQFSEVVRRARSGAPQQVTVHGKDAVVVVDPNRFELKPKPAQEPTMAGFIERSKKYRARNKSEEVEFEHDFEIYFSPSSVFDKDAK